MSVKAAWVRLQFVVELPDDDLEADAAFDRVCDTIVGTLVQHTPPLVYDGSIEVGDADTEEVEQ